MGEKPFDVCTWDEESDCEGCSLKGVLNCKWRRRNLLGFAAMALPFIILSLSGMFLAGYLTGRWMIQISYLIFLILFFAVIEARILCRHCPYYSKGGKTIRCHANQGLPRLWRYEPAPMDVPEKAALIFCLALFGLLPILAEAQGFWALQTRRDTVGVARPALAGLTLATLVSGASFIVLLNRFYCTRCVNFGCPLNRVRPGHVKAYLERNPSLKKAYGDRGLPQEG